MAGDDADRVFDLLDLSGYEETALETLLTVGGSTAPNLAKVTGIPRARIYGVLDELADRGFVEVTPSRPKEYQVKPPAELLDRAVENPRSSSKPPARHSRRRATPSSRRTRPATRPPPNR